MILILMENSLFYMYKKNILCIVYYIKLYFVEFIYKFFYVERWKIYIDYEINSILWER